MKLVRDWKSILLNAWSAHLIIVFGVLSTISLCFEILALTGLVEWYWSLGLGLMSVLCSCWALWARVHVQPGYTVASRGGNVPDVLKKSDGGTLR